jgi:type I restriction enzyme S subunit
MYWKTIHEQSSGIALANVNARKLEALELPLPPLAEQQRIVEAIEERFSHIDAGVALLKAARRKLRLYRASVLKAAVEGKLTEQWRAAHPDIEPAPQLLRRILAERRARWEKEQRAKGRDPRKLRYVEPAAPDVSKLPPLPDGWCWASLEELIIYLRNGLSSPPHADPLGYRILRINAVRSMHVDLEQVRFLDLPEEQVKDYFLDDGDILFTRYNGSLDLLGVAGMVRGCVQPTLHPDKLIRVKTFPDGILPAYIQIASNVGSSRAYIESRARTTAGQTGISGGDLKQMPIPLPALEEQEQIVALVEEQLSIIGNVEATIEHGLRRAERQRQSVLRQAFTGQLVPQDERDEPASVLLERIRRERGQRGERRERSQRGESQARGQKKPGQPPRPAPARPPASIAPPGVDASNTVQPELWEGIEAG